MAVRALACNSFSDLTFSPELRDRLKYRKCWLSKARTSKNTKQLLQVMKYMRLDQKGSFMAEYVWIDGHNGLRSKTKVSQSSPYF